jgi:hypothetical protein
MLLPLLLNFTYPNEIVYSRSSLVSDINLRSVVSLDQLSSIVASESLSSLVVNISLDSKIEKENGS